MTTTAPAPADPFTSTPDADPAECEIRPRWAGKREKTVELVGKPRRKKTDLSPYQRRWFEREGWVFWRVEAANAWGSVTVDMWGFADWIACKPDGGILLVQTCIHAHASTRARKAMSKPELRMWLASGGKFAVHGWRQQGGPGSRWEVVERHIRLEHLG